MSEKTEEEESRHPVQLGRGYCHGLAREAMESGKLPSGRMTYEQIRALQDRDPRYR